MQDFMKGRCGADDLTYGMCALAAVLAVIGAIADVRWLSWLALAVALLALARAFSKDLDARRRENEGFVAFASKVPGLSGLLKGANGGAGVGAGARPGTGHPKPSAADVDRARRVAKKMWSERKTSKFLRCPTCGQILSVPKGKGRIRVTCPKCHTKVETKS